MDYLKVDGCFESPKDPTVPGFPGTVGPSKSMGPNKSMTHDKDHGFHRPTTMVFFAREKPVFLMVCGVCGWGEGGLGGDRGPIPIPGPL